jgi:serine O-acetyltransferase
LKETCADLLSDCRRLNDMAEPRRPLTRGRLVSLLLRPEVMAVGLYRASRYCQLRGWRPPAGWIYRLNLTLTGADISPLSEIGAGCLIVHTVGTVIHARLGRGATLFAHVIVGAEAVRPDLADAPDLGDNVSLGSGVTVTGPVRIADHVAIAPFSLIDASVSEPGSLVTRVHPGEPMTIVRKRGHVGDPSS